MGKEKRPKPTISLISDVCGKNHILTESLHHGLAELNALAEFYPWLNLDELVAFAASSWKARSKNDQNVLSVFGNHAVYDIFSSVFRIGFPWLYKYRRISEKKKQQYEKLNPFNNENLQVRLQQVDSVAIEQLRHQLQEPVSEYVFECQYEEAKKKRRGDNHRLVNMDFQLAYPRKGKIVPAYAKEIAKIISTFPQEYDLG